MLLQRLKHQTPINTSMIFLIEVGKNTQKLSLILCVINNSKHNHKLLHIPIGNLL